MWRLAAALCEVSGTFRLPLDLCWSVPWAGEGTAVVAAAELVPGPVSVSPRPGDFAAGIAAGSSGVSGFSTGPTPCPGAGVLVDVAGVEEKVGGDDWGW